MRLLDTLHQDLLYALRNSRKNPGFAATAIVVLALGIGGNVAMFAVVRAVLLKPLDYREPDRLVQITGGATPVRVEEMRSNARSFTGIGAFSGQENLTLAGQNEPEVLQGARVSAGFLSILGVDPVLGRDFLPQEDSPGGAPVALISSSLWQRRFAGDPNIAGKTITVQATAYTIVGVVPARLQFPFPGLDIWLTNPAEWPAMPVKSRPISPFLTVFGRLKPGVGVGQANAEMQVVKRQYSAAHPTMLDAKPRDSDRVQPIKETLVSSVRSMLWMLFGAVGFVLLIACANVASLLLARATARSREFAVRAALGAARARLIGQLLAESLLLSTAGGALGLVLAYACLRFLPRITELDLPRAGEIHPDGILLAFSVALSILTGVIFGLAPAFGASRPDLMGVLRASGGAAVSRAGWAGLSLRGAIVIGQVALSIVLLIGAALLAQSVARLRGIAPGFDARNLLTLRLSLPQSRYGTNQERAAFYLDLNQRLESLPGVRGSVVAMFLPMMGFAGTPVQDAALPLLKLNERPIKTVSSVTPDYFRTMGIPLKRGREFDAHDIEGAQRVTIIDETLARQFWPQYPRGLDPVGQRLMVGGIVPQPARIVGIVADVHQDLENSSWPGCVYVALAQSAPQSAAVAIRSTGDPLRFSRVVSAQVQAIDRDQAVSEVKTMDELIDSGVGQRRLIVDLLGSFAALALLLALIGIYGVISYAVAQRTQEMGIRRALGAGQADILRLVIGQGLGLTIAGVVLGIGAALALTRVLTSLLFEVKATDPITFAGVAVVFIAVALAASYLPARRAARVDPMASLRTW